MSPIDMVIKNTGEKWFFFQNNKEIFSALERIT